MVSSSYSPATPYELQRSHGPDGWTVVGYYAERPPEADLPGYRAVDRRPAKKAGA